MRRKNFFYQKWKFLILGNDRYDFPDRILNYLIIKKLILKKKFKKVKIFQIIKLHLKCLTI